MILRMPWPLFVATILAVFALEAVAFGLLLALDASAIAGETSLPLPKPMIYSLQNLLGASFASLVPASAYGLTVAALESLAGIVTVAVVTAVFLARLLQTAAPLIFSKRLCLSSLADGSLYCRFVTHDPSSWLNVRYGLSLFMDVELEPGVWQRKVVQLELLNPATPELSLTATITHPIDARSPFRRFSFEQLAHAKARLVYLVEGTDEITGAPLLQVQSYGCDDIALSHRFADLIELDRNGGRRVLMNRLDELIPLEVRRS